MTVTADTSRFPPDVCCAEVQLRPVVGIEHHEVVLMIGSHSHAVCDVRSLHAPRGSDAYKDAGDRHEERTTHTDLQCSTT